MSSPTSGATPLVVALHDVAGATLGEVRWLLTQLDQVGVPRRVLKVIPAYPGDAEASASELAGLVRTEVAGGSEVVLHGWTHRADGRYRGSLRDRMRARIFAGGAAEFLALDARQMGERLRAGRDWLGSLGLSPAGFCAPGWLWGPQLPASARAAGFRYLVGLRGLWDLRSDRRLDLAPLGYMGAGASQELAWRLGEMTIWRPLAMIRPDRGRRFFLHPQGASRSSDCARVLREIERAARGHHAVTYAELLNA